MPDPEAQPRPSLLDGIESAGPLRTRGLPPKPVGWAARSKFIIVTLLVSSAALLSAWRLTGRGAADTVDPEIQQRFDEIKSDATREAPEVIPPDPPQSTDRQPTAAHGRQRPTPTGG